MSHPLLIRHVPDLTPPGRAHGPELGDQEGLPVDTRAHLAKEDRPALRRRHGERGPREDRGQHNRSGRGAHDVDAALRGECPRLLLGHAGRRPRGANPAQRVLTAAPRPSHTRVHVGFQPDASVSTVLKRRRSCPGGTALAVLWTCLLVRAGPRRARRARLGWRAHPHTWGSPCRREPGGLTRSAARLSSKVADPSTRRRARPGVERPSRMFIARGARCAPQLDNLREGSSMERRRVQADTLGRGVAIGGAVTAGIILAPAPARAARAPAAAKAVPHLARSDRGVRRSLWRRSR